MTPAEIAEFEAGIHPPANCPWGGCAQCHEPRTAHRSICVDAESGDMDCTCGLDQ